METTKSGLVLGLTGLAGSGKDSVFSLFKELLPNKTIIRVAFGDEVKKEYADELGVSIESIEKRKGDHRIGLQRWGTEYRREQDLNYWITKIEPQVSFLVKNADLVVITDIRFLNEASYVKEDLKGAIVRVLGDPDRVLYSTHESEVEMQSIEPDWIIPNMGSREELKEGVKFLIQENNLDA